MNAFEKEKKRLCPFSFVKAKTKERKKAFSCESATDATLSGKGSLTTKTNGYERSKNMECKSDTSEKQLVETISSSLITF